MKTSFKSLFLLLGTFLFTVGYGQEKQVKIVDFIEQHEGFEENEEGEIVPINTKEINKKIRFFIEEKYANVEYTRNIIWDSYQTFLSPFDRYHYHTFISQVKVVDIKRLKYLEVTYDPLTEKVNSTFLWNEAEQEFFPEEEIEEVQEKEE
ncbi:MAG: hypothetical protein ACPGC5_03200 [Flavobacteriaceae bacterium]